MEFNLISLSALGLFIFFGNILAYDPATCVQCRESHICNPPDCFCCRDKMPLKSREIPQMVFFSFDDAVNPQVANYYRELFNPQRLNPNGCPISMTLFVSHRNTVYGLVKEFYEKGMEIASHSVTHSQMNTNTFIREARKQKENLSKRAGIPSGKITGWRSPFLKPVGDLQPSVLKDLGYEYDATLTMAKKSLNDKAITPFTLDFGWPYDCKIKPCPTKPHKGFWEVPVVSVKDYLNKYDCVYVDGCNNPPPTEKLAYQFLWDNFQKYYTTNRAPMGINMHASWFYYPDRKAAMDRFIKQLVKLDDVYIISIQQVIEWLKEPTSLQQIKTFQPWLCSGNKTTEAVKKPSSNRFTDKDSRRVTFRPKSTHNGNFISNSPSFDPMRSWQTRQPRRQQFLPSAMPTPVPPMVPNLPMVRFWWRPPGMVGVNSQQQQEQQQQTMLRRQRMEQERLRRLQAEEKQARLIEQKRLEEVRQREQAKLLEIKRQEKLRQEEQLRLLEQQRQEKLLRDERARQLEQQRLQKLRQEELQRQEQLKQQEQARLLEQQRQEKLIQEEQARLLEQQRLDNLRQKEQAKLIEKKRQLELQQLEQAQLLEKQRQEEMRKQELARQADILKRQNEIEKQKQLEEKLHRQTSLMHQNVASVDQIHQNELGQKHVIPSGDFLKSEPNLLQSEFMQPAVSGQSLQDEFLPLPNVIDTSIHQNEFLQTPDVANVHSLQNEFPPVVDTTVADAGNINPLQNEFIQASGTSNNNLLQNEFMPAPDITNENLLQSEFIQSLDVNNNPSGAMVVEQPLIQNKNSQTSHIVKATQIDTLQQEVIVTQPPQPTQSTAPTSTIDHNKVLEESFQVFISRKLDEILQFRPSERTHQLELLSMVELRALQEELRNRLINNKKSGDPQVHSQNISSHSVSGQTSELVSSSEPVQNEVQPQNKPMLQEFHKPAEIQRTKLDFPLQQIVVNETRKGLETHVVEPHLSENTTSSYTQFTTDQSVVYETPTTEAYPIYMDIFTTSTPQATETQADTTSRIPSFSTEPTTLPETTASTTLLVAITELITEAEQSTTESSTSIPSTTIETTTTPPITVKATTTSIVEQTTTTAAAAAAETTTPQETTSQFTTTEYTTTPTATETTTQTKIKPTVSKQRAAINIRPMWTISQNVQVPWQRWITKTPVMMEPETTTPKPSVTRRPAHKIQFFTVKDLEKQTPVFNVLPFNSVATDNDATGIKLQPTAFVNVPKHYDINGANQRNIFTGINAHSNRFLSPIVMPIPSLTPQPKLTEGPRANTLDNAKLESIKSIASHVEKFTNKVTKSQYMSSENVSSVQESGRVSSSSECIQEINCMRPNCVCKSSSPPGSLKLIETPQIVYITVDGSLNFHTYGKLRSLFSKTRLNPNGCRIKGTVFISDIGSSYRIANVLKTDNIELAMMGVSSRPYSDPAKLKQDIVRQRKRIAASANISPGDIKGWRSPGLSPVGDEQYKIIANQSLYDSSLLLLQDTIDKKIPYPHTLDFGWMGTCQTGTCPNDHHSGVWEVPIIPFNGPKNMTACEYIDACTTQPSNAQQTVDYLMDNFNKYYKTNKAPFAIRLKQMWFHWYYRENFSGLLKFLDKILSLGDVYITSVSDMLEWMKAPKSIKDVKQFAKWKC
ncbi:putative mediator of RNA polymerase II transcription subunit 26 [Ruditapes philippinarum]|uniref:putative mediator of RNA polymerase II transcription subunit 26 n=1 Tax=Ruditapes philippinarum TaxID=129788 RepID=UPI00295BBFE5|nr:putative mediator of RNA polymerase II transcription subunit 26 [Ruditapes philippinarum]